MKIYIACFPFRRDCRYNRFIQLLVLMRRVVRVNSAIFRSVLSSKDFFKAVDEEFESC